MLYFAYGSNMCWKQMKERCPSAAFFGIAKLPDHRLAFTRKSVKRDCGVADAIPQAGSRIWGVVYHISEVDIGLLDTCEGYRPGREKNSYWRRECLVFLDGDESRPLTVHTYFADQQSDPPPPNRAYKDQMIDGARFWGLPSDYIAELEAIEVSDAS